MSDNPRDLLLEWVSERGSGSWSQFRDVHAWLQSGSEPARWETASMIARQMSALGHIEVDWRSSSWAASPPVLTLLPAAGAHALLTGARTRELSNRLGEELDDRGDAFLLDPIAQALAPSALLIACEDERAMQSIAARLGIKASYSAASQLAAILPRLASYLDLASSTPAPKGYGVQALDPGDLSWNDVEEDRVAGLYRYQAPEGQKFRLVDAGGASFAVDLAVGTFVALASAGERQRLKWFRSSLNGDLEAPLRAPLPTLHARALALCSGLAPERRGRALVYINVPEEIGRAVAASLGQELKVVD
jgi:hypothetical protein